MKRLGPRVVKVGGSQWRGRGWPRELQAWVETSPPTALVLVAGGGEEADGVRELDRRSGWDATVVHWLAIQAMRVQARCLSALHPDWQFLDDWSALTTWIAQQAHGTRAVTVFDPWSFLRDIEPQLPGLRLECNWDVTSDSIAARLASVLHGHLTLIKACRQLDRLTYEQAAQREIVDASFPKLAAALAEVEVVCLQDPSRSATLHPSLAVDALETDRDSVRDSLSKG